MQKQPLTHPELTKLQDEYMSSNSHDNLLFFVILLVSFHALMCLGKLVWLDKPCKFLKKCPLMTLLSYCPKVFFSFYWAIKLTASLKETELFFSITLLVMTLMNLSKNI